jgi:adenosylmethionine-8-amino-7-oxononanoate aminotransferase
MRYHPAQRAGDRHGNSRMTLPLDSLVDGPVFLRDLTRAPILIERAEGVYLYDANGTAYLDAAAGAAVAAIGHGRPEVAEVLARQANLVAYAHPSKFITRPTLELAEKIVERAPSGFSRVFFTSGGSESVEAAIKLARQVHLAHGRTERTKVVSRRTSYHGATLGALAVTGQDERVAPFTPLLKVEPKIAPCYPYRCELCSGHGACTLACADDLERVIELEGAEAIIAFIAEPIVGSSAPGADASPTYWRRIRDICDRHDVVFIADEVMSGNGRSGTWWAMQQSGVIPDLITTAKGIGGGYAPLGALLVRDDLYDAFRSSRSNFRHGHTYSGNPLSAAVGSLVIDVIERENLLQNVRDMGALLRRRLQEELGGHPHVGDIRGQGLLLGVEFVADRDRRVPFDPSLRVQREVSHACLDRGMYVYQGGGSAGRLGGDHVLIAPPFVITADHVEHIAHSLRDALDAVVATLPVRAVA